MPDRGSEPLTDRLTEVIDAGLQFGASLARRLAEATGSPRTAEKRTGAPIDDLVRFGSEAAGNVLGLVAAGARSGANLGTRVGRPANAAQAPASTLPMVTTGSTLRVPLLVENTGPTPTRSLTFSTVSLARTACEDAADCDCLDSDVVSFDPETLVVAAHDFEKLTVRFAVPLDAPPGDYKAELTAGDGWFSTTLRFSVVPRP